MKYLAVLALLFTGCAPLTIRENGSTVFRAHGYMRNVTFKTKATYFHADEVDPARTIDAQTRFAGEVGTTAIGLGLGGATATVIP